VSIVKDIISGGADGLLSGIGSFAKDLREAITGEAILDPNKRAEILMQTQTIEAAAEKARLDYHQKITEAQTAINALEAQSSSIFVAGWRPFVGWVCASGLVYTFLLKPILPWAAGLFGFPMAPLPEVPMGDLIVLLGGMLGLGTLRTVEKRAGVSREVMSKK
jgi:hypothetical protein